MESHGRAQPGSGLDRVLADQPDSSRQAAARFTRTSEVRRRRLHFVRHGESAWNVEGRLQGQTMHVPLTRAGRRQAQEAASSLGQLPVARLITSDQLRAQQTAHIIGARLGLAPTSAPQLREQALGSLEGKLARDLDLATTSPGQLDPQQRWGGGENVADVYVRLGQLLVDVLADGAEGDVVLVSHGDTIRIALAWLHGVGPQHVDWAPLPNGAITTVTVATGAPLEPDARLRLAPRPGNA